MVNKSFGFSKSHRVPKCRLQSWKDNSVVKSTCSCRGPRFDNQQPHSVPQPYLTPVLGDPMPLSSDLLRYQARLWFTDIYNNLLLLSLFQCFESLCICQNCLKNFLKHQWLDPNHFFSLRTAAKHENLESFMAQRSVLHHTELVTLFSLCMKGKFKSVMEVYMAKAFSSKCQRSSSLLEKSAALIGSRHQTNWRFCPPPLKSWIKISLYWHTQVLLLTLL